MGDLREQKFKECAPRQTVARIRGILSEIGLMPVESEWFQSTGGFSSLRLSLPGTCIGVNGKGTTPEYALASAYGEMMERLQNMAPFRLAVDMPARSHRRGCFLYAPDEIPMGMGEVLSTGEAWMRGLWDTVPEGTDRVSYLRRWKQVSYEDRVSDFYGITFHSLIDGAAHMLPMKMLSKLYMSNGMCAGNSREEALIQGLCECFERYANKAVVLEGRPLVQAGREHILWPLIRELMEELQQDSRYTVTLYDASLGLGLPVAAVLLTDRTTGGYLVKFGAGPSPEIAVERTLTELMQGQQTECIRGMQPIHIKPVIPDAKQNMMGILTHGIGVYPFDCFQGGVMGEWPDYGASTSAETLAKLLGLVRGLGYDVLARDVSYLGFPAAHVVVPGMSEVGDFGDGEELTRYTIYNTIKRKIRALGELDDEGAAELLVLLDRQSFPEQTDVLELLYLKIEGTVPWYYRSVRFQKISLALRCGDFGRAADLLHVQAEEAEALEAGSSLYYRCARDVCLFKGDAIEERTIRERLGRFYPEQTLDMAIEEMQPGPGLYRRLGTLPCFDCEHCDYANRCAHPGTEDVYGVLKKQMKQYDATL